MRPDALCILQFLQLGVLQRVESGLDTDFISRFAFAIFELSVRLHCWPLLAVLPRHASHSTGFVRSLGQSQSDRHPAPEPAYCNWEYGLVRYGRLHLWCPSGRWRKLCARRCKGQRTTKESNLLCACHELSEIGPIS